MKAAWLLHQPNSLMTCADKQFLVKLLKANSAKNLYVAFSSYYSEKKIFLLQQQSYYTNSITITHSTYVGEYLNIYKRIGSKDRSGNLQNSLCEILCHKKQMLVFFARIGYRGLNTNSKQQTAGLLLIY